MTLVYRCPKLIEVISNYNPGPGSYEPQLRQHKTIHPSPTFISKVEKNIKDIEESQPGPSSYFKEDINYNKEDVTLSVFKSKIQRFGKDQTQIGHQSKQKIFAKQFNELMKKQKIENINKGKLIDMKLKKQRQEKINNIQNLPSIPSQEHSFGYRFDDKTNKLVYNHNPKIIFTQNVPKNQKEHFYFQRESVSDVKSKTFVINPNSKRIKNQLTHQLSNPTFNAYNSHQYFTIQNELSKGKKFSNFASSITHFTENSPSKRELLTLQQIKKKFQPYIKEEIDLNKLQKEKYENKSQKFILKKPLKKMQNSQIQCFLSRQSRFQKDSPQKESSNPAKDQIKSSSVQKDTRSSFISQHKKKQPFQLGSQRFKPKNKQILGPGTYNLKQTTLQHGVSIIQKEQRFKTQSNEQFIPGPGAYEITKKQEQKQNLKCSFNKYRNTAYFNEVKQQKQNTMQNLYQQVGKHMNYLNKMQKNKMKDKQNKIQNHRKNETYLSLDRISQAKNILKQKLSLGVEEKEILKQNRRVQQHKNPKYQHLYHYNKPQQTISQLGPGCYELRTTLDKKTFNKTVKS